MSRMFEGASAFNGTVWKWHIYNVTDFSYMFKDATSFTGYYLDWAWDGKVSSNADTTDMFKNSAVPSLSWYSN